MGLVGTFRNPKLQGEVIVVKSDSIKPEKPELP